MLARPARDALAEGALQVGCSERVQARAEETLEPREPSSANLFAALLRPPILSL
jgi:hypothetical protein